MAREIKVNVKPEMLRQARDDFSFVFGRTMDAWAAIERSLYHWFWSLTRLKDGMARAIYFGTRGFGIRLDMLEAAIEHADGLASEERAFITKAINKARSYSSFRNAIAHGEPIPNIRHTTLKPNEIVGDEGPTVIEADAIAFSMIQAKDVQSRGISIDDMLLAHNRFQALANAINLAAPQHRNAQPIEPLLRQVTGLPNEPDSRNDQTAQGRGQPHQPGAHVNKKAHRAAKAAKKAQKDGGAA